MSTSTDERGRTHTINWKIENFNMYPPESGENTKLNSTFFKLDLLSDAKVCLLCYPVGTFEPDNVAVFLKRAEADEGPSDVHVGYELSIVTVDSKKECVVKNTGYMVRGTLLGSEKFVKRRFLMDHRKVYLPMNNTLFLRCEIWRLPPERLRGIYSVARSTVATQKMSFHWDISDFMERTEKARRVVPNMREDVFEMRAYMKSIDAVSRSDSKPDTVVVDVRKVSAARHSYMLKAKISVIDDKKKQWYLTDGEHIFTEKDEIWEHPIQLERQKLLENKDSLLPDGYLTLFCELVVAGGVVTYQHVDTLVATITVPRKGTSLSYDLRNELRVQVYWDVLLTCHKFSFPAQRWLLSARSSVFKEALRAMTLLSELEEKVTEKPPCEVSGPDDAPVEARQGTENMEVETCETKQKQCDSEVNKAKDRTEDIEIEVRPGVSQEYPFQLPLCPSLKRPGKARVVAGLNKIVKLDVEYYSSMYTSGQKDIDINGPYSLHIANISITAFRYLLKFMYLDEIEEFKEEHICELYVAAKRFNVPSLARRCVHLLRDHLNSLNVYRILIFAKKFGEEGLKKSARDFLFTNMECELPSTEWEKFAEKHPRLSEETLQYIRLKRREVNEIVDLKMDKEEDDDDS